MMGWIMTVCFEMVRVLFVGTVTQLSRILSEDGYVQWEHEHTSFERERLTGDQYDVRALVPSLHNVVPVFVV